MSDALMTIPLSQLRPSAANVRKTDTGRDLDELAASILAHGLLQNLTVRKADKGPHYEVVAGGRRLAALRRLAKAKRLPKGFEVPCRVLTGTDGIEISLAENVVRAPLHPADQFEAFSALHDQGQGIEEIAARFGVAPTLVQQRLKLAAVSPRLMAVYRDGEMSLDQLTAFTLTDDHAAQERVWFEAPHLYKDPRAIRQALTRSLVEGSDRRARFVGAEAYEAAGGQLVRDLFQPDDEAYFADSELLDRLVAEKLRAEAEKLKAEGWAWVEVLPELDYGRLARFRRIPPTETPLSAEDEAKLSALCEQHDALVENLEEEPPAETVAELDRLSDEIDTLSASREQWSNEDKACAGVFLALDYQGELVVRRGYAKPDDVPPTVPAPEDGSPAPVAAQPTQEEKPKAGLSDALVTDLSAHRTAALRETVAGRPDVALTALLHALVLQLFHGVAHGCVDIRAVSADLRPLADGIGSSKAGLALAERHERWLERLPEADALWPWLETEGDATRAELLAYCVGIAVNASSQARYGVRPRCAEQRDLLAGAVKLDMADWWQPTRAGYFARVSKTLILEAVTEAVSPQAAENISRLKKDAMASRAEELLADRRWLPPMLRTAAPVEPDVPAADT
jgi:ParB family chromosome partitioning protein